MPNGQPITTKLLDVFSKMGSGLSRPTEKPPVQLRDMISAPMGTPVMVPPESRDANGIPIQHEAFDLGRDTTIDGLRHMAAYLNHKGVTARIVIVGGAVNTLYLRSRRTTHDVDFFIGDSRSSQNHTIHQAAQYANRQLNGELGVAWCNNYTQIFMPDDLQQELARAAIEQNTIVYSRLGENGGLVVYAAPWSYALCGKFNRLSEPDPRRYDLKDAVVYLHEYLRSTNRRSLSVNQIYRWCECYYKKVTDTAIQQLDDAYYQTYGRRSIKW